MAWFGVNEYFTAKRSDSVNVDFDRSFFWRGGWKGVQNRCQSRAAWRHARDTNMPYLHVLISVFNGTWGPLLDWMGGVRGTKTRLNALKCRQIPSKCLDMTLCQRPPLGLWQWHPDHPRYNFPRVKTKGFGYVYIIWYNYSLYILFYLNYSIITAYIRTL